MTAPGPEAHGRRDDLLFCARCGESVSRPDLLSGAAQVRGGRVLCARCAASARKARALVVASFAVSVACAALVVGSRAAERLRSVEGDAALARARADTAALRAAVTAARLDALALEVRGLQRLVEAAAKASDAGREEARGDLEVLVARLQAAERALAALEERDPPPRDRGRDGEKPPAGEGPPGPTRAEELVHLARLGEANPGTRLSALVALRRGKSEIAREAALRGLKDADAVVRREAASLVLALGLKDREALSALVDALADSSPLVRDAAVASLRALEGTDLGYDPLDPPERRAETVARWRERLAKR